MFCDISGKEHKLVKKITGLKEKKYRERYGEFVVEGALSVEWALESDFSLVEVVVSQGFSMNHRLAELLGDMTVYRVPEALFAKMADTKTPQGILCTLKLPQMPPMPESGLFIYCDSIRDPGNLGTIIRTADAMGFDGVILSPDCVDPFNPKLVRSAMGSLFHLPLFVGVNHEALLSWQKRGFSLAASALSDRAISIFDYAPDEKTVIIMGNESAGVSKELIETADFVVKIPMVGSAESLNVAAAASIFMFHGAKACHKIG